MTLIEKIAMGLICTVAAVSIFFSIAKADHEQNLTIQQGTALIQAGVFQFCRGINGIMYKPSLDPHYPHCENSKVAVVFRFSDQWKDCLDLARKAQEKLGTATGCNIIFFHMPENMEEIKEYASQQGVALFGLHIQPDVEEKEPEGIKI